MAKQTLTADQLDDLSKRLLAHRRQVEHAEGQLEKQRKERDVAMLAATQAGMSRRLVAELAGVTSSRVQQVVVEDAVRNTR